jgi:hypothetical protein
MSGFAWGRWRLMLTTTSEYTFPESDRAAIKNLVIAQEQLTLLVTLLYGDDAPDEVHELLNITNSLQQAVRIYCD